MKRQGFPLGIAAALALSACGNGGGSASSTVDQGSGGGSSESSTSGSDKALYVVESGFGQKDQYAWVTTLVHNDSAKPGDFVVANFNLKDASGTLIKSGNQTEQFYKQGQDLALGTQVEVPEGKKIASIDVTAATTGSSMPVEGVAELGMGPLTLTESYGAFEGQFEVTNPSGDAVSGARIGVICEDSTGKINGGGSSFPDLVPPTGKVMAEVRIIASAKPASCTAHYGGKL